MKHSIKDTLQKNKAAEIGSIILILISGLSIAIIGCSLLLLWRKFSQTPYKKLGLYRPDSWIKTFVYGILLGIIIKLIFSILIMPLMGHTPGFYGTFDFLKGNIQYAILFSFYVIIVGGFSEELIFRGFLFYQYEKHIGNTLVHKIIMVVSTSLIFGIPHFYLGGLGVIQSILVGSIYGIMYLINKKNLWMVMIAHAVFDLVAIYIIYNDLSVYFNELVF